NGNLVEIGDRVEADITRAHVDVVDVEQEPASRVAYDVGQEIRLWDRGFTKAQVARRILDEEPPTERVLRLGDVVAHQVKRLVGVRERQQVIHVASAEAAPGEMIGDQRWLDAFDESAQAAEMPGVERIGASE